MSRSFKLLLASVVVAVGGLTLLQFSSMHLLGRSAELSRQCGDLRWTPDPTLDLQPWFDPVAGLRKVNPAYMNVPPKWKDGLLVELLPDLDGSAMWNPIAMQIV